MQNQMLQYHDKGVTFHLTSCLHSLGLNKKENSRKVDGDRSNVDGWTFTLGSRYLKSESCKQEKVWYEIKE